MIFSIEDYYTNEGLNLTPAMQENILKELERIRTRCRRKNDYQELHSIRDFLKSLGIKVVYNWPGHREEWFFPTYDDAIGYEDWLMQCMD